MFEKLNKSVTAKWFLKNKEGINFDLAIQRGYVWDIDRKSLFIHSLICDYPFPAVYAQEKGDNVLHMLDGKQRISTVIDFMEDKFKLSEDVQSVDDIEIAGLLFSELSDDFKDAIKDRTFLVYYFRNMTDNEREEMFLRLNSGVGLSKQELTRVMAGTNIMEVIQSITKKTFFNDTIILSDNQRNRFIDEEIIMQILLLMQEGVAELSSKAISNFMIDIREKGLGEESVGILEKTTEYLGKSLPIREKYMKKVNIPMIFLTAMQAIEDNIAEEKFGGLIQKFFSGKNSRSISFDYNNSSSAGSAKKENVRNRLENILDFYSDNINTVSDYVIPVAKPINNKGRKREGQIKEVQGRTKPIEEDIEKIIEQYIKEDMEQTTEGAIEVFEEIDDEKVEDFTEQTMQFINDMQDINDIEISLS